MDKVISLLVYLHYDKTVDPDAIRRIVEDTLDDVLLVADSSLQQVNVRLVE